MGACSSARYLSLGVNQASNAAGWLVCSAKYLKTQLVGVNIRWRRYHAVNRKAVLPTADPEEMRTCGAIRTKCTHVQYLSVRTAQDHRTERGLRMYRSRTSGPSTSQLQFLARPMHGSYLEEPISLVDDTAERGRSVKPKGLGQTTFPLSWRIYLQCQSYSWILWDNVGNGKG